MNNVRLNVEKIPVVISGLCLQISHIHDVLVAQFTVL